MLCPSVNQEWVDEGKLPRERTKNWRWRRPEFIIRESVCNGDITRRRHSTTDRGGIVRGNTTQAIVSREGQDHTERRVFRVYASKLASDESLGCQHTGAVYHRGSSQIISTSEFHGGDLIILRYDRSSWRVGLLQCSHCLREPDKSEDKAK
ncbi:hypothetical protein B296_00021902 [Ensete ventricosum]|uniref:Uncharacterized protein n=1 Tax=Ensete ventricosum TaxID=4639 RepID=A0A426YBY0_ENSVE|nr:hypothetical protein B296_00021902 [Ensete ventricosum]